MKARPPAGLRRSAEAHAARAPLGVPALRRYLRRVRRIAWLAATLIAGTGVAASAASAATRYVAVGGVASGTCAAPASPCTPAYALTAAADGDRVLIAPGTYVLPASQPAVSKDITVGGDPALPRPVLLSSGGGPSDWVLWVLGSATQRPVLQHVDIRQVGTLGYALLLGGQSTVTVQDVTVSSTANAPVVLATGNGVLRDSVVRAAAGSVAISGPPTANSLDLRNVTAFGGSVGLSCATGAFSAASPATVTVRNSILLGTSAGIRASGNDATRKCLVLVDHSNFATADAQINGLIDQSGGGNQTAPPAFVDVVGGDVRPLPGSPTIDGGVADPLNGPTDPDGRPRTLGSAPDIGAFEYAPPPTPTPTPTPAPAGPAAPTVATSTQAPDATAPSIILAGVPRSVRASALRRGISVRVTTSEPARLGATLTTRRAKLRGKKKTVQLASATLPQGTGTRILKLRASTRGGTRVTLTVTATDAAGNAAALTRTVRITS